MMSFDVEVIFTSLPIEPAITIIKKLLKEDKNLHQRTTMTVKQISCLLEFCLTTTYFTLQGKMFEQVKGAAMGSPISPKVANLFMEDCETKPLAIAPSHPHSGKGLWMILSSSSKDHKKIPFCNT